MKNVFILFLGLFISTAQADVINGFTAEFDPTEWQIITEGNSSAEFSDDKTSLVQESNSDQSDSEAITDTILDGVSVDGTVSFDWLYTTGDDPFFDYFGWLLNGEFTLLSDISGNAAPEQNGSQSYAVKAGDTFGFRTVSDDSIDEPAIITISNFAFTPSEVPEPSALAFFAIACLFAGFARRRKA